MAIIRYKNVGIRAMAACVPQKIAYNKDLTNIMSEEEVEKMISSVGIHERRICDDNVFASDLCFKAAKRLMEDNEIAPESIDMLLFMSQGADFRIPATSCILQHRLGLSKDCAAIDLSLGCSGYVYALSTAMAY
ncbi:MAG: ketoacyl-ACP synthase III, partial [Muribaculum sp.]|nr:ketoacyl-ACP synthase III [Muribaculum sp.]